MAGEQVLGEFEHGARGEKVRAVISEFKGETYISIRTFYLDDNGKMQPGRNGINIPISEADEFFRLSHLLEEEVGELLDASEA